MNKCECPEKGYTPLERQSMYSPEEKSGMNHLPNECAGTNEVKKYRRVDKEMYLCSCCNLFGDELISDER